MPTFNTPEPISATINLVAADVRIIASDRQDTVVEFARAPAHTSRTLRPPNRPRLNTPRPAC